MLGLKLCILSKYFIYMFMFHDEQNNQLLFPLISVGRLLGIEIYCVMVYGHKISVEFT